MVGFRLISLLLLSLAGARALSEDDQTLLRYLERAEAEGILDEAQLSDLLQLARTMKLSISPRDQRDQGDAAPPEAHDDDDDSAFMRIYGHLTLLNVLYLSGAVIVMGAYSLFMTLVYEKLNHGMISGVMAAQVLLCAGGGIYLWYSEEYAYLGGM